MPVQCSGPNSHVGVCKLKRSDLMGVDSLNLFHHTEVPSLGLRRALRGSTDNWASCPMCMPWFESARIRAHCIRALCNHRCTDYADQEKFDAHRVRRWLPASRLNLMSSVSKAMTSHMCPAQVWILRYVKMWAAHVVKGFDAPLYQVSTH